MIDAIHSRCTPLRFPPLDAAAIAQRLETIVEAEDLPVSDDACLRLARAAKGDLRAATNLLQAAVLYQVGSAEAGDTASAEAGATASDAGAAPAEEVTVETVETVAPTAPADTAAELVRLAHTDSFAAARAQLTTVLHREGVMGDELLDALERVLWRDRGETQTPADASGAADASSVHVEAEQASPDQHDDAAEVADASAASPDAAGAEQEETVPVLSEQAAIATVETLAEADERIRRGGNARLQLEAVLATVARHAGTT